ncbi:ribosome maturation factor RimP [Demequina lutea]|uniref:Ribosome maturation factor RimP n=1 Tax=Demequina lutea TaxID=431489 RepID=A0A7Y9ZEC8_9MICO|nr:ribosome maturation factor RimP [Demequina lutea]NYI41831.1 ribosome maturation factor RimP [Demequina lutea]
MKLDERIADLARPAAEAAGLIVDSVTVSAAGKNTKVLVTVDLPEDAVGSVDLDTVATASRAIGDALDAANVPAGAYLLEVSTPGTDRPLTLRRHFMRARTRLVDLEMVEGSAQTGRIVDVTGDALVLDIDGETKTVALDDVKLGRVQVEMKRLD